MYVRKRKNKNTMKSSEYDKSWPEITSIALSEILHQNDAVDDEDQLAEKISEGIVRYAQTQTNPKRAFRDKFVSLCSNLNHKENGPKLIQRLVDGELEPEKLAFCTPDELYPELWERRRKEQEQRDFHKIAASLKSKREEMIRSGYQGVMTCGKCKSNLTEYYEKQTRSADEPMTQFVTCYNCGNKWKQ